MSILKWSHKIFETCDTEDDHCEVCNIEDKNRCFAYLKLNKIVGEYGCGGFVLKFEIKPIVSRPEIIDSYQVSVCSIVPGNELPISSFDDLKTMNDAQIFGELVAVNYVKNAIDDLTKILDQSTFKHSLKEKKLSLI